MRTRPRRSRISVTFAGALALVASFAVSSVPGATLGYFSLRALRRAGLR